MTERIKIIIDGNNFSNLEGFFCEADAVLTKDITFKTGHNLDAFNDLLCGGFGVHNYGEPLEIHWKNSEKSRKDLGYNATVNYYKYVLSRCHHTAKKFVSEKLNTAEKCVGETLFDMICHIITDTDNTGHNCTLILE